MTDYKELLEMIMDALDYSTLVDENGKIIYMSKKYRELGIHKDTKDIIGKNILEVVPNSRIPGIMQAGKRVLGEYYLLETGDDTFANRFPLYRDGQLKGLFAESIVYNLDDVVSMNIIIDSMRSKNQRLRSELQEHRRDKFTAKHIIGSSLVIEQSKLLVQTFADSNLPVLLTGETGTGKEVFANAIHYMSHRWQHPFIKINCAAIPSELLESELFGYEEGAFTGASKKGKPGKFELANKGTILLDEIGDMPLFFQSKLLRVLQDKTVERVGGVTPRELDVRIICSTNQNLEDLVDSNKFRSDLYYRINTVEINIPPLRERKEDIGELSTYFIERINTEYGLSVGGIDDSAVSFLKEYDWNGNVRELEHVLQRACVSVGAGTLTIKDFAFLLARMIKPDSGVIPGNQETLQGKLANIEKEEIIKAVVAADGNKTQAAKLLGIDRTSLHQKLKKYNLNL